MMFQPSSPLQGTLGYVLVSEILVVTGLSWLLIGMILRKIRYGGVDLVKPDELPPEPQKIEHHPEYQALLEKNRSLEAKLAESSSSTSQVPEDYDKLKSTIQFLEKKLLEYEIVQEEISTLGDLKLENEKLREEVQSLKGQALQIQTEKLITKDFSEFSEQSTSSSAPEPQEKDLQKLLTEIETLSVPKPQAETKKSD